MVKVLQNNIYTVNKRANAYKVTLFSAFIKVTTNIMLAIGRNNESTMSFYDIWTCTWAGDCPPAGNSSEYSKCLCPKKNSLRFYGESSLCSYKFKFNWGDFRYFYFPTVFSYLATHQNGWEHLKATPIHRILPDQWHRDCYIAVTPADDFYGGNN